LPKQSRSSLLLAFKRVVWIGPKPRASRENILIVRIMRVKGTIQATLSILFQHPVVGQAFLNKKRPYPLQAYWVECACNKAL